MKLYGIKNCDTVRKARKWLTDAGIPHEFHDFKSDGLDPGLLASWEQAVGWETLINRRGTTWRKLPEQVRDTITAPSAHDIMLSNPSVIKRPVVDHRGQISVGFSNDEWASKFLSIKEHTSS